VLQVEKTTKQQTETIFAFMYFMLISIWASQCEDSTN